MNKGTYERTGLIQMRNSIAAYRTVLEPLQRQLQQFGCAAIQSVKQSFGYALKLQHFDSITMNEELLGFIST
jgi:hypothetical protein